MPEVIVPEPTQKVEPVQPVAPVVPVITPLGDTGIPKANTDTSTLSGPNKKLNLPNIDLDAIKNMPKKFKIMGGVVGVLVFLLILVGITGGGKKVKNLIIPSAAPIPSVSPIGEVLNPSPYASDPEVLDIENKLNAFIKKVGETSLREDTLRPVSVDWDINFKNQ